MDVIHGIDQKASKFWMRVHTKYDEHKKLNFCKRSVKSLTNRSKLPPTSFVDA
jgi:hypothetical protein